MVAKISVGNSLYGSLVYNGEKINKEKGKVLATNKIYNDGSGTINIHRAFEDFKMWMPQSTKAEKPMMHISLNPHPDDRLSDAEYAQLAHEYMEKMGFADMPYLIVKHEDIDRHHIHIVALRVRPDGTAISTKNNFYKSKEITRELEKKYGLHSAERQKVTPDMPINKVDPNGDVKRQVAMAVKLVGMRYKFQTLGEYNAVLSLYNIRCEEADGRYNGREYHGLVYFAMDDDGKTISTPLKASRLGKFAGREAVDQRYQNAKEKIDVRPTKRKVAAVMAQSSGKDDFIARLKTENIDLCFDTPMMAGYMGPPISTTIPGQFSTAPVSARSFLPTPLKSGSIIRLRNRLSRRIVTLRTTERLLTIVSISISIRVETANPTAQHPTINPTGTGILHNQHPLKANPTDMMTLPCSRGWAVCSLSARLSMHRKKPSIARCNGVRRKNVVVRNSNSKFLNQNKYVTTRR